MNLKTRRVIQSVASGLIAAVLMDFVLSILGHFHRSLFLMLPQLWADPRIHGYAMIMGFGYAVACALGAASGWVYGAPTEEELAKERLAKEV